MGGQTAPERVEWAIWKLRPAPIAWPVMAACLLFGSTIEMCWAGNTAIWLVAAVALAGLYGWPSVICVLKPTLGPFALLGIWRRSWWLAIVGAAVVSVPFAGLWLDYWKVALNARGGGGWMYSLYEVPTMLLLVAAWLASERGLLRSRRRPFELLEPAVAESAGA